ncbi:MAG: hypothetical protein GQ532_00795 [Methylomarinum sp.]|nr:hypothetical protein [Methylomarinum sp.]
MKTRKSHILIILMLILSFGAVNAATFPVFNGNSAGSFAATGTNVDISGQSISWGIAADPFGGQQSSLTYAGDNPFSVDNSDPFKVGVLTYNNTSIKAGTGISSAGMGINLNFTNPSIGPFDFNFDLIINNTLNNGSISTNSDTVTLIPSSGFSPFLATIDDINYYFMVLGFMDQTGNIVNSFLQPEGASESVGLYAQITTVNPVPAPPILWLLLTAFVGMFIVKGRRFVL